MLSSRANPLFRNVDLRKAWRLGWDMFRQDKNSTLPGIEKSRAYRMSCMDLADHYALLQMAKHVVAERPDPHVMVVFLAWPALKEMTPEERREMFGLNVMVLTQERLDFDLSGEMPSDLSHAAKHMWATLKTFEDYYDHPRKALVQGEIAENPVTPLVKRPKPSIH